MYPTHSESSRSRSTQPTPQDQYDFHHRNTPQSLNLPLRSPSISVSPRGYAQPLPTSRPTSSSSNNFSFQPPGYVPSPSTSYRRLSGGTSRPGSASNGRQYTAEHQSRPGSRSTPYPYHAAEPVRSPSPIILKTLYNPHRRSDPESLLYPITAEDVARFKTEGLSNNPLRKRRKRPLPSWSNTTPGARSQPGESDHSYFPEQDERRPGSTSGRTSVSNDQGQGSAAVTPAPDDRRRGDRNGAPISKKRQLSDTVSVRRDSPEGHDPTRRKISATQYTANVAIVANHCKLAHT